MGLLLGSIPMLLHPPPDFRTSMSDILTPQFASHFASRPPPLLAVRGLNIAYGGTQAVRHLDFDIAPAETVALVGESGCGKSTTALSLLRLLPPSATVRGSVHFDGTDLLALGESALNDVRGNRIAMIFQEPMLSLNPVLTIGEQVGEALRLHRGLSRRAARARAIELLDMVKLPEPARRIDDYPHRLSGGQRQRAMIAAAVACEPRLLIADEPTTALDVTIQAEILSLLDGLRQALSMSVLLITHDLGVVADWADRVIVMHGGRALEQRATAAFFQAPGHAYSQGLLGASLHLASDKHYRDARLPEIRVQAAQPIVQPEAQPIAQASAGAHADEASEQGADAVDAFVFSLETPPAKRFERPAAERVTRHVPAGATSVADHADHAEPSTPLLRVEHLHTTYFTTDGPRPVVKDVSFIVDHGETVGLVGESGCGKSTLSRTIMRLIDPASGRIVLDGQDIAALPRKALLPHRRKLQMIFQDPHASLNPRQTVSQILHFALTVQGTLPAREHGARVAEMIDAVGLPRQALARYPHEFSGGQRQRIGIARALIVRPALVICDEPVSALDVSVQAQILNLLVDLKHEYKLSMLFISHDLAVIRYIADRVLVMRDGAFVEQGDHDTIWAAPRHPYTQSLLASVPGHRRALHDGQRGALSAGHADRVLRQVRR